MSLKKDHHTPEAKAKEKITKRQYSNYNIVMNNKLCLGA